MPGSSGPFGSSPSGGGGGQSPLLIILLVLLGLGTVGFGILTVTFSSKASTATKSVEAEKATAAAKARDEQKKLDDDANTRANESPYRAYTAPQQFGSFVVNFPKNWSSFAEHSSSGTQVHLVLNPDFLRKTNGQDELMAARIKLIETPKDAYLATFTRNKEVKQTPITVSDQPGFELTGKLPDRKSVRIVVVPIRDKVLVFSTENATFANEFNEILSQAKIIP